MNDVDFLNRFGFEPNVHELRIANGRDPLDESRAYVPAKYHGTTLEHYQTVWRHRGAAVLSNGGTSPTMLGHVTQPGGSAAGSAGASPSQRGPGTELKKLLTTLGITERTGCDCNAKAAQMDAWGVAGCRSHFGEIVGWMRDGAKRWGWLARLAAGAKAVRSGVALRIHWLDPFEDLVRLAIEQAERGAGFQPDSDGQVANLPHAVELTIGLATFDDAMRARWTIRALQELHPDVMPVTEFLVINNDPGGAETEILNRFAAYNAGTVRVVDCATRGTFPPKAAIFEHARGKVVLVLDSHVIVRAGGLRALLDFYRDYPTFDGLIHGPIVSDGGEVVCTHQEREFGGPGIGRWGNYLTGNNSSVANPPGEFGHRVVDVPMSGNWCWATLRSTWPRDALPQGLRGYGGDEHLDGLFHKLGRRVVIHEALVSWHDYFHRAKQHPNADKLRNDLLWLRATGEKELEAAAIANYDLPAAAKERILREIDSPTTEAVFAEIVTENKWGGTESVSGPGSSLEQTAAIREALPKVLAGLAAKSLLDLPCGDHHWMSAVDLSGVEYIGADIVGELIDRNRAAHPGRRFERLDLLADELPRADVVLVRDCLVHLPFADVLRALRAIVASGSEWLLTTTFPGRVNHDIALGEWRPLDLTAAPFGLPAPTRLINEGCTEQAGRFADKSLGLWRVADLARQISQETSAVERTLTVIFHSGTDGLRMDRTTSNFPRDQFSAAMQMLANDLIKETTAAGKH